MDKTLEIDPDLTDLLSEQFASWAENIEIQVTDMNITHLQINHLTNPVGYRFDKMIFSFLVEDSYAEKITYARLVIAEDPDFLSKWYDSGVVCDPDTATWEVTGLQPKEQTRYYWKVEAEDSEGVRALSDICWFETAKEQEWLSFFISPADEIEGNPVIFKEFEVNKPVKQCRLYITGLGLYEVSVNQQKCGEEYLTPGFCDYFTEIPYQTYEVDLTEGENCLEVTLGNGWYKGVYGMQHKAAIYGDSFSCIAELHIWYEDGEKQVIGTDLSWKCKRSRIVTDSIYDGEVFDSTVDNTVIYEVRLAEDRRNLLVPRINAPVVISEIRKPVDVLHTPAGETVLDMGQIITGWVSFKDRLPEGTRILFQFGEVLQDGNFYRGNLRKAKAEFSYLADGSGRSVRGHFSYCGFRYVKITGWPGEVKAEDFTGLVLGTRMEQTGWIETSNPLVNRLFQNALWGQRCNFVDIPTDCPQRDARMGWTGDAQMISGTAAYNMDVYAFYRKYLHDLSAEQKKAGGLVPHVVPSEAHEWKGTSAAWGDASTIIPWNLYLHYGDQTILEEQYESMKAWVDYIRREDVSNGNRYLWMSGNHFGDWLALDAEIPGGRIGKTDPYYIASAYYYHSTEILAKTAGILGKREDHLFYKDLLKKIKEAIQKEYFTGSGTLAVDTMTAHVLALHFNFVPEQGRKRTAQRLRELLRNNDYKLNTGFVGTPYLCPALSANGMNELAYRLLLNEEFPGWLFEVRMGATTIWERWNSILPDGRISGTGMNSLNHFCYGSVMQWMYEYAAGFKPVETAPGFRRAEITPHPDLSLRRICCRFQSNYGLYESSWRYLNDNTIRLEVTIPVNAGALIRLIDVQGEVYARRNGEEVLSGECTGMDKLFDVPAGYYEFLFHQVKKGYYSMDSTLMELLKNPETSRILHEYFPDAERTPCVEEVHTLREFVHLPFIHLTQSQMEDLDKGIRNCSETA